MLMDLLKNVYRDLEIANSQLPKKAISAVAHCNDALALSIVHLNLCTDTSIFVDVLVELTNTICQFNQYTDKYWDGSAV